MASPPSSSLRFARLRDEQLVDRPLEWEPTWLVLDIPTSDWSSAGVSWNGAPLPVHLRRTQTRGAWVVAEVPRLAAGFHRFVVSSAGGRHEHVVRVAPRKLDDTAFEQMLVDLQQGLGPEIALALRRAGALAGVDLQPAEPPTLSGERLRLQRAILGGGGGPGLLALLPQISRDRHEQLVPEQRWVAGYAARRVLPALLPRALVRTGNMAPDGTPSVVVEGRSVATVDTYENQVVRTLVDLVRSRAGRFVAACRALGQGTTALEVTAWLQALDRARAQAGFLAEVSTLSVAPSRMTMVLARKPAYRAALESLRRFLRSCSVRCDPSWFDAPLDNLPMLYQLWGTLQVHLALLNVATDLGFRVRQQRLVVTLPTGLYVRVLPDGKSSLTLEHPSGVTVSLTPERTFGATGRLRSLTYPQRPDITIEIRQGEQVELWLFDPKYKLLSDSSGSPGEGRPTKEDLDKMHAYRDAIRGPDGRRIVRFAATLYPGPTETYGTELAAVRAWPGEEQSLRAFIETHLGPRLQTWLATP